jgi:hypothetical protein
VAGIPRITRPRRKHGTSGGFTVEDPGGNWLRISSSGSAPEADGGGPFERVMLNAARQGDARGNEAAAIAVLEAGLTRHADATAVERVPVLVYLAELLAIPVSFSGSANYLFGRSASTPRMPATMRSIPNE